MRPVVGATPSGGAVGEPGQFLDARFYPFGLDRRKAEAQEVARRVVAVEMRRAGISYRIAKVSGYFLPDS